MISANQYELYLYLKEMGDASVRGIILVYDNDDIKRFQSYDELLDFVIHNKISVIKERYQKLLDIYIIDPKNTADTLLVTMMTYSAVMDLLI